MKKTALTAVFTLFSCPLFCQVWYFGQHSGIDFSSGKPIAIAGPVTTDEGVSVVYDRYHQVLFSTDGVTVYGFDNRPLPNGTGLYGHPSTTQSALLLPVPGGNFQRFFLFTADAVENNLANGLRYSVIYRTLNPPNGDIPSDRKNLRLPGAPKFACEKLAAVSDNQGGFWLLAHGFEATQAPTAEPTAPGYTFYAWHLTGDSLGLPVMSHTGSLHNFYAEASPYRTAQGQMAFSPDGSRLALAVHPKRYVEVFDFDRTTGKVSNPARIGFSLLECEVYGVAFSPSGRYLFVSTSYGASKAARVYQIAIGDTSYLATFQTTELNGQPMLFKAYSLAPASDPGAVAVLSPGETTCSYGSLAIGPDGAVYVAATLTSDPSSACNNNLGRIVDPDSFPARYEARAIELGNGKCRRGLPNLPAGDRFLQPGNTCMAEQPNLIAGGECNDSLPLFHFDAAVWPDSGAFLPGMAALMRAEDAQGLCGTWKVNDHSSCPGSRGRFWMVNGKTNQPEGTRRLVWEQMVTGLKPGATYRFCTAVKAMAQDCFDVTPRLDIRFSAPGQDLENVEITSGQEACDWMELSHSIRTDADRLTLRIFLDESLVGDGNDVALDDIGLFWVEEVR